MARAPCAQANTTHRSFPVRARHELLAIHSPYPSPVRASERSCHSSEAVGPPSGLKASEPLGPFLLTAASLDRRPEESVSKSWRVLSVLLSSWPISCITGINHNQAEFSAEQRKRSQWVSAAGHMYCGVFLQHSIPSVPCRLLPTPNKQVTKPTARSLCVLTGGFFCLIYMALLVPLMPHKAMGLDRGMPKATGFAAPSAPEAMSN